MFGRICLCSLVLSVIAACGGSRGKRADGGMGGDARVEASTGGAGGGGADGSLMGGDAMAGGSSGSLFDAAEDASDAPLDRAIDRPGDAGRDASIADGPATDSSFRDGETAAAACIETYRSNLPGVSLVFLDDRCTFTLAEAAAGITFAFKVRVLQSLGTIDSVASDAYGPCQKPEQGPFIVGYEIAGDSQRYCPWWDTGRCVRQHLSFAPFPSDYQGRFTWHGRNYLGPSDTGQIEGAAFPPGIYTVTLNTEGTWSANDGGLSNFQVVATRTILLTP